MFKAIIAGETEKIKNRQTDLLQNQPEGLTAWVKLMLYLTTGSDKANTKGAAKIFLPAAPLDVGGRESGKAI